MCVYFRCLGGLGARPLAFRVANRVVGFVNFCVVFAAFSTMVNYELIQYTYIGDSKFRFVVCGVNVGRYPNTYPKYG